jgi:hypothetical protein
MPALSGAFPCRSSLFNAIMFAHINCLILGRRNDAHF